MKFFQSQPPLFHICPNSASSKSPRARTPQLTEDSQNFSKEDVDTITHRLRTERRNIHALDSFDAIRSTIRFVRRFRSFDFDFDSSILVDAPLSLPYGLVDRTALLYHSTEYSPFRFF